ncbi:MAG: DUF2608 domain-containing protein [Alphaproteobacteria bacterium]|nr:DUF2608 domain-containing protein [Alphaproteobacteria bacterium]OJV16115.1 MAG: hypothetical protein BGO27_02640 [Alphaproteobacteria bacterium 33-17]
MINQIKYILGLFLTLLIASCTYTHKPHQVTEIYSFKEANFDLPKNTLVIFDVDETLIQPLDSYLINEHTKQGKEFRNHLIKSHPEVKDWDYLVSIILRDAKRPLIEPCIVYIINNIKSKDLKFIALTGMNTGRLGMYSELAEWRYEHLKSLGFQGSFGDKVIKFKADNRNPIFFKGILATDLTPKGPVLIKFLKEIDYYPKAIVMFDDDLEHIKSVSDACKKLGINFMAYHYKGAKSKAWNQNIINYQTEYLIKHKKWLSDEEVKNVK